MKSQRLNSLVIIMLFSIISFAQTDTIKRHGSPQPIYIRHLDSIDKKYQALYVLDGKIIDDTEFKKINPETIESVTILKDSLSKTLFNGQARNGIILIKSKKLSKKELRKMKKKKT
ncbi:MAG: TonB-dependent receptor plug domain-containing protein [Flavobacterium sp.]|uniref:TonB-dependent receptor plug domain-containing protein n=1 Tax=Flavobacterium sp. TaxID=239 RepID=UPI003264C7E6